MIYGQGIEAPVNPWGKLESKNQQGDVTVSYTGSLEDNIAGRIYDLKVFCNQYIGDKYPVWKQNNAALGVYSEAKTKAIKESVASLISQCDAYEQQLLKSTTLEEVWSVNFQLKDIYMTIYNTSSKTASQVVDEQKDAINGAYISLKAIYLDIHNSFWNNPDVTPEEVVEAWGTEAAGMFQKSIATETLLATLDPDYTPLEIPYDTVVNPDGTVTITPKA